MKIFSVEQIRQADQYTIQHEPISSVDLMERAATTVYEWLSPHLNTESKVKIFCGMGNNGGDGLVLARLMYFDWVTPQVYMVRYSEKMSPDCEANYQRLLKETKVSVTDIRSESDFPSFTEDEVIIDALFGSGLNRPVEGLAAQLIDFLNHQKAIRVAIDIASGLFADRPSPEAAVFRADYTLTFQVPKLAFFMPENDASVGHLEVLDIQLHPQFLDEVTTLNFLVNKKMMNGIIHHRPKYSHKGTYGHALLIAGSPGKLGAGLLSTKACLRTGVGLLSVNLPLSYIELAIAIPEAMYYYLDDENSWDGLNGFSALGVGPGLGTEEASAVKLRRIIQTSQVPMVLDADALNILSENKTWLSFLPARAILTPHPKEFERLFGKTSNSFERLELLREMATKHNLIIVLKGAHTAVAMPNGAVFFNSTGNPGMATAGSGDVLTGMILSLLAQHYSPEEAAMLGVYLHGLAGDLAADETGQEALMASDIIDHIGKAFLSLES